VATNGPIYIVGGQGDGLADNEGPEGAPVAMITLAILKFAGVFECPWPPVGHHKSAYGCQTPPVGLSNQLG
jgi:hypothetical protein